MGTRNVTMVISGGETKVAQYGQWDGYPSGQGVTILNFLKRFSLKKFKKQLDKFQFRGKKQEEEMEEFMASIGSTDGWMNSEQAEKYHTAY